MTAQTLDRGIILLRCLSVAGLTGRRLIDLQRETGLTRPTVHRLLETLKQHSLVEQLGDSKRYRLGPEIAILGWSVARQLLDLKQLSEDEMGALATDTGDTSYLVVRTGYETVCIDRKTGAFPIKAFTVDVGKRRPLGIGATGIALLGALDPEDREAAFSANAPELRNFPRHLDDIRQAAERARRDGYAVSDGTVLLGVRGLAMGIRNSFGRTVAAIGVASIAERMSQQALPSLVEQLRNSVRRIERSLHAAEAAPDR